MYGILILVLGGNELLREIAQNGWFLTLAALLMGNGVMLLYDHMLEPVLLFYLSRRPGGKR